MLIDSGANVECKPQMLQQFGVVGSIYMERCDGRAVPAWAWPTSAPRTTRAASSSTRPSPCSGRARLNFIGNIEARDIPVDAADVVVAEHFTGNVILEASMRAWPPP